MSCYCNLLSATCHALVIFPVAAYFSALELPDSYFITWLPRGRSGFKWSLKTSLEAIVIKLLPNNELRGNPKQKRGSLISFRFTCRIRSDRPCHASQSSGYDAMPATATGATLNGSVGAGERLGAWRCFRENLLGGGRKSVHVAEKCHRLPNLRHS